MHEDDYRKRNYPRGPRVRVFDPDKHCGSPANDGNPCTMFKGTGTDHVGEGRCVTHDLGKKKSSIYEHLTRDNTKKLLRAVREEVRDPLDLEPEIELLRAMIIEYHDHYEEFKEGIITFHNSFNKAVNDLLAYNDVKVWSESIAELRKGIQHRPVRVPDISRAADIVDILGRMVERVHKMKSEANLTPERVKEYRDRLVVIVMEEVEPEKARRIADKLEKL